MSNNQQINQSTDGDERMTALMTNSNAIKVIAQAVEGTIGPKGLDTMLVDQFGDVVVTNDGVTILGMMDVNHPAAKMLIKIARAQQEEIGDGTTTATIMAGELVSEGVAHVSRGVPVAKVLEGLHIGIKKAQDILREKTINIDNTSNPILKEVALVAGRGHDDIAALVIKAAQLMGKEKLADASFKLADIIRAQEGADNKVISGVILDREPLNKEMPKRIENVKVLVIDDALEPEEIEDEALGTEAGFTKYMQLREEFRDNVRKIAELGVNLVLVDRGVDDIAEEILADAEIMVLQRVANKELRQAAEHTGAKLIKRTGLKKRVEELQKYIGESEEVFLDEKIKHVYLLGGKGKALATILVGASTEEVVGERERIAKDAASAVQAAVRGGIVSGGGAVELAIARGVEEARKEVRGMAVFGVDCVIAALTKPFSQIVLNAGFNPLEKLGNVTASQVEQDSDSLGIDCESGEVVDMCSLGVYDPALVKKHALKAAGEVAEAILRIDTIIKKKACKKSQNADNDNFE